MRKRLPNGRFSSGVDDPDEINQPVGNYNSGRGFLADFKSLLWYLYRVWMLIPYLILIILFYKYFRISFFFNNMLIELACGDGCSCSCQAQNNTIVVQPKVGL